MRIINVVIVFLICLDSIKAQPHQFKSAYASSSIPRTHQDSVFTDCRPIDDSYFNYYLNRDLPSIDEIESLLCVLSQSKLNKEFRLNGLKTLILAHAFSFYDQVLSDSLYQQAYFLFVQEGDIDGEINALAELIETSAQGKKVDALSSLDLCNLLIEKSEETDFFYSKMLACEAQITKLLLTKSYDNFSRVDSCLNVLMSYEVNHPNDVALGMVSVAVYYKYSGQIEKSIEINLKILELINSNSIYLGFVYNNLAQAYSSKGNMELSMSYWFKALEAFRQHQSGEDKVSLAYYRIGQIYKRLGRVDSAYSYSNQALDALYDATESSKLRATLYQNTKFNVALKNEKLEKQEILLKKNRQILFLFIGLFLSSIGVVVFLIRNLKNSRRLSFIKEEVAKNREHVLRIISHDLISPLSGLIRIAEYMPNLIAKGSSNELGEAAMVFKSTAILIQNSIVNLNDWYKYQANEGLSSISKLVSFEEILQNSIVLYKTLADTYGVKISPRTMEVTDSKFHSLPLEIMIRNLLTNSIKNSRRNSNVYIDLLKRESSFELCFESIPKDINSGNYLLNIVSKFNKKDYVTIRGISKGLGLELIFKSLIDLNSTIDVEINNEILKIKIHFPEAKLMNKSN